jgi:hypothetical protein
MRLPSYFYRCAEVQYKQRGRISSVSIVTTLRLARRANLGSIEGRRRILSILHSIQTALRPKQSHTLWLPGNPPPVVNRPSIEAAHSPTFSAVDKNAWIYTCISSYVLARSLRIFVGIRIHYKYSNKNSSLQYVFETLFYRIKLL